MRITHCDGPDCQALAAESTDDDEDDCPDWLTLTTWTDTDNGDFCSWECLAAHALTHALGEDAST